MAPHSNDAPYCLLPSCKKLKTFNDRFPRKYPKKTIFDTWSPFIPRLRFFLQFRPCHLYWPSTWCKISQKTNEQSLRYLPWTPPGVQNNSLGQLKQRQNRQQDLSNLIKVINCIPFQRVIVWSICWLVQLASPRQALRIKGIHDSFILRVLINE